MGGIGLGIVLFAIGAVLRFAVYAPNSHANVGMIGVILMIVGGVAFVVGALVAAPRRYRRNETYVRHSDGSAERVVNDRSSL